MRTAWQSPRLMTFDRRHTNIIDPCLCHYGKSPIRKTGVAAEQGGRTGTPMQNKRTRTAVARQRYNSIQCFRGRCTRQSAVSYR
eukprot:gene3723-2622_t